MGLVEIRCENCRKPVYINKRYVRKKMFCTLRCMDMYNRNLKKLRDQHFENEENLNEFK